MNTLPAHLANLRVLVVDDVELNLEIFGRQIAAVGVKTETVGDAFAALAALERAWYMGKPFDIVFLDHMMPGISGAELVQRVRANKMFGETRLVMVSSAGIQGVPKDILALLDGKLDKPVRQHELMDCLMRIHSAHEVVEKPAPAPVPAQPVASAGLNILLAEDNKINQKFASVLLTKAGHRVTIAENGHQAVDAVRHGDFDIVLMDVQMPDLDGVGATREIRAMASSKSEVPIIAMTAHAMAGAREEYLGSGMNDYVAKPVQRDHLFAVLAKYGSARPAFPTPQLDPARMDELVDSISLETARDLLQLFVIDTLAHIGAMTAADLGEAARQAHAIVSAAGNMGVIQLSDQARLVEAACREGRRDDALRLIAQLQAMAVRAGDEIARWIAATDTPRRAQA